MLLVFPKPVPGIKNTAKHTSPSPNFVESLSDTMLLQTYM